jgi:hypothetical protein
LKQDRPSIASLRVVAAFVELGDEPGSFMAESRACRTSILAEAAVNRSGPARVASVGLGRLLYDA